LNGVFLLKLEEEREKRERGREKMRK